MKFCEKCDNMYYISIDKDDPNKLTYYCRCCGHIDEQAKAEGLCVLETNFKQSEQKYQHMINPYTKLDPTLPRIYTMKCPNQSCKTNKQSDAKAEILYLRYDDDQLKYLYMCVECDTTWKTDDRV